MRSRFSRVAEPPRSDDPLVAFSEGRMTKEAAVKALGLRDYTQILLALGERGLPMPGRSIAYGQRDGWTC